MWLQNVGGCDRPKFKPHIYKLHITIIVIIVIIAMLTLYFSIMSHATLIFF